MCILTDEPTPDTLINRVRRTRDTSELMRGFDAGYLAGIEEGRKRMMAEMALAESEPLEMVLSDREIQQVPF